ncbi:MAG: hypothetical protein HYS80_02735 [Candidatus Aenigmarchaeota archaeon]|nr:hypothetical protein [Candidatus Aenigmarchaeota archaeon]
MGKGQTSLFIIVGITLVLLVMFFTAIRTRSFQEAGMPAEPANNTVFYSQPDDKYLADPTYCERDEDCDATTFRENDCCSYCELIPVNKRTKERWIQYAMTCDERPDGGPCFLLECIAYNYTTRCINNTCILYAEPLV